jgi:hypothetical protein
VVAQLVTRDSGSTLEKVERLHQFVYLNVSTPGATPVIDDTAADVLIRGVGYCDQAAWALARLAQEVGVPGRMFYLQAEGSSPHTVAELYVDGDWRVFDVLYGVIPQHADGTVATVRDIVADPSLLGPSRASVDWYRDGYEVPLADPASTKLLQPLASAIANLPDPVANALQDAYLTAEPRPYVDINGTGVEDFQTLESRRLYAARNYQLFLRQKEAVQEYRTLALDRATPQAEDALYQLGLIRLDQLKQPVAASQVLHSLLRIFPQSRWHDDAQYLAARADEASGRCRAAEIGYQEVSSGANRMEDSQTRLSNLQCMQTAQLGGGPS